MLKYRFVLLLVAAAAVFPARPARAAEAWLETLARSVAAEIESAFADKISVESKAPLTAGVYRFTDLSGKFGADAPLLRRQVFAALAKNKRFSLVGINELDEAFDALYPLRTLDQLTPEQLEQLARKAGADYIFSAKTVSQDNRLVLQVFIYNARKGALLLTPMLPVNRTAPEPAPEKPAPKPPEKPAPEVKPEPAPPEKPAAPAAAEPTPAATATRLFQNIEPSKFTYVQGVLPDSPVVDFEPMNLDEDAAPEVAFLNTDSMVIVKLRDRQAEEFWSNPYRKSFARRGLAGTLWFRRSGGKALLFVSMNSFPRTIVYVWNEKEKSLDKLENADRFIAHIEESSGRRLVSDYGRGVISFSGKDTRLAAGANTQDTGAAFPLPEDYYSGCILRASDTSNELTITALADETGTVKIYQGAAKLIAETEANRGGSIDCWNNPRTGNMFVLASTEKNREDRLVLLRLAKKPSGQFELAKQWVSDPVPGAIPRAKFHDLDGDRLPEILGVEETPAGKFKFFYTAPSWPQEEY